MKNKFKIKKGFTLVEMLVAVALFTLIASISIGAILSIFDANRRNQSSKTVVDNLNLSIENMVRTVRFGTNYHSCDDEDLEDPQNCNTPTNSDILAVEFNGDTIVYRWCGNAIKRSDDGEADCNDNSMQAITSPETVIEYVRFYVLGSSTSDNNQPYVIAVIQGYVGNKPTIQSKFSIETLMSQRILDI